MLLEPGQQGLFRGLSQPLDSRKFVWGESSPLQKSAMNIPFLPGSLNPERAEAFGFGLIQCVFDKPVHTASARTGAQTCAKVVEVVRLARCDDFHVPVFGISNPAAQLQFAGLAMDKPAEANPLHAALNEEMKDHLCEPTPVSQTESRVCN